MPARPGHAHEALQSMNTPAASLPPLEGTRRALGTFAVALATFMNVLDSAIANVSIPAIAGDLGVSPAQGTWVITSFGVATAISVPLTGWLSQRVGQARLFVGCVILFTFFSWMCGAAPTIEWLIAARVLQGLAAGPMIPMSQTLLLASYPRSMAGTALSWWSMTTLFAPVVGPLLGGWLTDNLSWPWIFYINIPIGFLVVMIAWPIFRDRDPGPKRVPIDAVGLALLVIWVGALQLMVDTGKEHDWFESSGIVALAVVSLVGFMVFLAWELTEKNPIVNLRLFADRNFLLATITVSLGYGLFFASIVLLPLWLQQTVGYTATWAGIALAPVGLFSILLSPFVGRWVNRVDPRGIASFGFLMFALVMALRANFTVDAPFMVIAIPTVIQGIAVACFFLPMQPLAYRNIAPHLMPSAAGLNNFLRMTAGAVSTSLCTTWWDHRSAMHRAEMTERVQLSQPETQTWMQTLHAQGLDATQALSVLSRIIDQQAQTLAVTEVFLGAGLVFFGLIAMLWTLRWSPITAKTS